MPRTRATVVTLALALVPLVVGAQSPTPAHDRLRDVAASPITDATLREPDAADWLMYSRTYDAQRYSPLDQIDRSNVGTLQRAWTKPLPEGPIEVIPLVHKGVLYLTTPGNREASSRVWALDATNGDLLWEYAPPGNSSTRVKALALYADMLYYTAPAPAGQPSPVVALDAATGKVRWQTPASIEAHTGGAIVVEGKVVSGRTCNSQRSNCFIAAHDARTGQEVWRFYTTPGADEPGDASWAGAPADGRRAATWGLPGTYDPMRHLIYWGISNPMPNTRAERHGGNADAIPPHAPADLYSNSTVALNPATGKLVWYYQHLPGDDWDMDINHEKTLIRTVVAPDAKHVKWISPAARRARERDIAVTVGEGGGIWANDRATGEFLWATPFPFDTPNWILSGIDPKTGIATINRELVLDVPGERALVCYWNTRSFWPTAYSPRTNSLYVPYVNHCLDMARADKDGQGGQRGGVLRPGSDPARFAGLMKIDMRTGEMKALYEGRAAGNGAVLATAGGLVFWGDIAQVLRAFDAETGKVLWQSEALGASVQTSTITYAVDGRQYVAVINAEGLLGPRTLASTAGLTLPEHRGNSINVFALPR
jgi:PQQ-dependent dehydrogenase (methanol/ethanol family)